MSRNTKIVLAIVGGLVVICCSATLIAGFIAPRIFEQTFGEMIVEDREGAAAVGQSILTYSLPDNYAEEMAMDMFGMSMVIISPSSINEPVIMLMRLPSDSGDADADTIRREIEEAFGNPSGSSNAQNLVLVGEEDVVINDTNVTLSISEGQDDSNRPTRQVTGVFPAKDGNTAMLLIAGPIEDWNQDAVDAFIDSLN